MDNWKKGPLPPDTWNWGGIVLFDAEGKPEKGGFYFASFCGDHVELEDGRIVKAEKIALYNNSLTLPEIK